MLSRLQCTEEKVEDQIVIFPSPDLPSQQSDPGCHPGSVMSANSQPKADKKKTRMYLVHWVFLIVLYCISH